jgi:hypothetical protein
VEHGQTILAPDQRRLRAGLERRDQRLGPNVLVNIHEHHVVEFYIRLICFMGLVWFASDAWGRPR